MREETYYNMPNNTQTEPENDLLPVIITLVDGETLKGSVSVPRAKSLGEVLNGSDAFILFRVTDGELIYLARNTIAAVQSNKKPEARQLDQAKQMIEHASPWQILGLTKDVDLKTARATYYALIKQYHPDQYVNIKLPGEVCEYLEAVVLRLNAAWNDLLDEMDRMDKLKKAEALRQQKRKTGSGDIRFFGQ